MVIDGAPNPSDTEVRVAALERAIVALLGEEQPPAAPSPESAAAYARTALASVLDALDPESFAALVDPFLDVCDSWPEAALMALREMLDPGEGTT